MWPARGHCGVIVSTGVYTNQLMQVKLLKRYYTSMKKPVVPISPSIRLIPKQYMPAPGNSGAYPMLLIPADREAVYTKVQMVEKHGMH